MKVRPLVAYFLWCLIVLGISVACYLPLEYWRSSISLLIPKTVSLQSLNGHWWNGNARLSVSGFRGPFSISWSGFPILGASGINVEHEKLQAIGSVEMNLKGTELSIDYVRVEADAANPFLSSQKVGLAGEPIYLKAWSASWEWGNQLPISISGEGKWSSGDIFFRNGNRSQKASVKDWQLLALTQSNQLRLGLLNHEGGKMVDVKSLEGDELELSIMPNFLKEVGINWTGDPDYPAFVLVQPINMAL